MPISRGLVARLVVLSLVAGAALVLGVRAASRVVKYRAVDRVCEAARRGEWPTVLEASGPLVGTDPEGLRAAECRCRALVETGGQEDCLELLEGLVDRPEADGWLPQAPLTAALVVYRETRGRLPEAAELARRGAAAYPGDTVLLAQELALRSRTEDEGSVLDEMRRRLDELAGRPAAVLILRLAHRHAEREEWARSAELLGSDPDRFPPDLREAWFRARVRSLAGLGDVEALAAAFEEWRRRGGDPPELRAYHALLLSSFHLLDPERPTREGLLRAVAESERIEDRELVRSVYVRLIRSLVVEGDHDRALELYDRAVADLGELELVTREDILRSATLETLGVERLTSFRGTLRFRIADHRPGDRLLLAPGDALPVDSDYRVVTVPGTGGGPGVVEVEANLGTWPQRWVLRDARDRVLGSGAVWPTPRSTVEVAVARREPGPAAAERPGRAGRSRGAVGRRPGDGRRRVFLVVLDCADWRLVQYGRARGEMPFFGRLAETGRRTVLESVPPFTAVAITKLVYPEREGIRSLLGVLHRLGAEVEGLNFVGVNPLAALEAILPAERQMFESFAARGLATVNLLRSHGPLRVGREARIVGPGDAVRRLSGYRASRPLTAREREILGNRDLDANHRDLLEEMAADFDLLESLAGQGAAPRADAPADAPATGAPVDFVAVRVASLDLLTHGLFQEMNRTGQDDGQVLLYRVYRYMDRRLDGVAEALDRDDVLVVLSDHGIRTPMEHDPRSLFVAAGEGIAPGRVPGSPPIRTVTGWIADMLGVATEWPGAGRAEWIAPPKSPPRKKGPR